MLLLYFCINLFYDNFYVYSEVRLLRLSFNDKFLFSALQGVRFALFIIFLGIVPVTGIILLLVFYFGHHCSFCWKSPASKYMSNCLQHIPPTISSPEDPPKQYLQQKNIKIIPIGMTSTTNTDGIVRSKSINRKDVVEDINCKEETMPVPKSEWRISFKNFRRLSLKINTKTDLDSPKTAETDICEDDATSFQD